MCGMSFPLRLSTNSQFNGACELGSRKSAILKGLSDQSNLTK